MTSRALRVGLAVGSLYVAVALATFASGLLPARPLYDGLAPPAPYRWVDPPPDVADQNVQPEPASTTIELSEDGSRARSLTTPEGQAIVVFQQGTFAARADATAVEATVTPLDPSPLPEPPGELRIDGNAYRVDAAYVPSGQEAVPQRAISVVLRYPAHATLMLRLEGRGWERLATDVASGTLQVFADSDELGTFVAAGVPTDEGRGWLPYAVVAAGLAAAAAGYWFGRRGSRTPPSRQARRARRRDGR